MPLPSNIAWEIRTTGSDTANGGGFTYGAFIAAPTLPTVSPSGTGGTVAANTYYIVLTYTDGLGETVISPEQSVTTSGATSSITVTSPSAATGALTWACYVGTAAGGPYFPQGTALVLGSNRVITATPPTTGTQPRGVDYSQQTGVQVTIDNAAITATTAGANSNILTFTAGHTPVGAEVGNVFRATGGTNINAGSYVITAITATTWTVTGSSNLTTAGGAGAAITGVMGGCLASPGGAGAAGATAFHLCYVKAGSYTIGNGTANTAGNKVSNGPNWVGYSTNRYPGNTDTQPVFDAGAASMTMVQMNSASQIIENISFTNSAARATVTGIFSNNSLQIYRRLSMANLAVPVNLNGTAVRAFDCYFDTCGTFTSNSAGTQFIRCVHVNATLVAFNSGTSWLFEECVAVNPGTAGFMLSNSTCRNCVATGLAASAVGFNLTNINCIVENCITYNGAAASKGVGVANSWLQRVTASAVGDVATNIDPNFAAFQLSGNQTLTVPPFTDSAAGDYSLNNTAGGGLLCRGAGIPGTWPGLSSTTGHRDIGAVQTSAAGAGGATRARVFTGM